MGTSVRTSTQASRSISAQGKSRWREGRRRMMTISTANMEIATVIVSRMGRGIFFIRVSFGLRIQHLPDLLEQRRRGEWLVEEGHVRLQHSASHDGVARVAGHVEHLH